MRKTVVNKEYVQLEDIIFMKDIGLDDIPNSIMEKFFDYCKYHTLFSDRQKEYLELSKKEEIDYIKSKDFILNKNYLDILDNDQLKEELKNIKRTVKRQKEIFVYNAYEEQNEIDFVIQQYKFNSFVDYLNERIEKSCVNCENYCYKPDSLKTGLDKEGKPVGNDCHRFANDLKNVKKYEYELKGFNI